MPRRPSGKENDASAPAPKKPALSTRAGESGGGLEAKLATQLAAADLADAGASVIVLAGATASADVDALEEIVDLCCEIDVAGVPMRQRLGLRAAAAGEGVDDADQAELVNAALELGLLHFDACAAGARGPRLRALVRYLERSGADAAEGVVAAAAEAEAALVRMEALT